MKIKKAIRKKKAKEKDVIKKEKIKKKKKTVIKETKRESSPAKLDAEIRNKYEECEDTRIDLKTILLEKKQNIYCGGLRRIGKTSALLEVIKLLKVNNDDKVAVLVPSTDQGHMFKDSKYVDEVLIPMTFNSIVAKMMESKPANIYLFSDEISNVEQYLKNWNIKYLGGFYSGSLNKIDKHKLDKKDDEKAKVLNKLQSIMTDVEKL